MKRFTLLILGAALAAASTLAQEIPADIKEKLVVKSAEVNPDSEQAARAWVRKQATAWETIQYMDFAGDPQILKMVKEEVEKLFPLDFLKQESYLSAHGDQIAVITEYKAKLGDEDYEFIKGQYLKDNKFDLQKFTEYLIKQSMAKDSLNSLAKPDAVDDMTFTITKEVAKKKFPGDYMAQMGAIKEQLGILSDAEQENADDAQPGVAKDSAATEKPKSISELNQLSKDIFQQNTLSMEGPNGKATFTLIEIKGRQVLIGPASAYSRGESSIINSMSELVDFSEDNIYVSTRLPLMIIIPTTMPEGVKTSSLLNEKEYRDLIGNTIFFTGISGSSVQAFPVKVASISESTINMSTRMPTNFQEGTILIKADEEKVAGMGIYAPQKLPPANWNDRSSINRYNRLFNENGGSMISIRLDKLDGMEKLDPEKAAQQKAEIERLTSLCNDMMKFISATRFEDGQSSQFLGDIVKKYTKEFRTRMEKSRFERVFRSYLQDVITLLRKEIKVSDPKNYYSIYRNDATKIDETLNSMLKAFDKAARGQITEMMHESVKRQQSL